jgi:hypothetical protein
MNKPLEAIRFPINNSTTILIDKEDLNLLTKYKWHVGGIGYIYSAKWDYSKGWRNRKNMSIALHRLLIKAKKGEVVDHINGDIHDNRKSNLRICTQQQNAINKKRQKNNTSGYVGVSWSKILNKWEAYICPNYKKINLGFFENKSEAALKYNEAARKYYKNFARVNII